MQSTVFSDANQRSQKLCFSVLELWFSGVSLVQLSSRLAKAYKYAKRFYKKGFVYQNIRCSILLSQLTCCSQRTKRKWRLVGFVVKIHISQQFYLTFRTFSFLPQCSLNYEDHVV